MSITFFKKSSSKNDVVVLIHKYAVYISEGKEDKASDIKRFAIENGQWQDALNQALSSFNVKGKACTFIAGVEHYQIYQVDEPKVPKEEWSVALPFLLKDVISERVTDVVADAVALPKTGKVQAYVIKRQLIEWLKDFCDNKQLELHRIIPDYEIWAPIRQDSDAHLLLHRAKGGNYAMAAFYGNAMVFQRTIRGIIPPITASASGDLQFDSLALELQRSLDYLSGTYKQAHFNKLFIQCDEDNAEILQAQLSNRLSVSVEPLVEQPIENAELLIQTLQSVPQDKIDVNLYPQHLRPQKDHFTLTNVVLGCLAMSAIMLGLYGFYEYQATQEQTRLSAEEGTLHLLTNEQKDLQQKLARHQPDKDTEDTIERLKKQVESKQLSLRAVDSFEKIHKSQKVGYSGVMGALSRINQNDVALKHIFMDGHRLNFSGLARTPASVPVWLQQFKQEADLVGRTFESLNIGRNEDGAVTFKIDAKLERSK